MITLTRIRLLIQSVMLLLTVYGGWLTGPYLANKISNNLPALSCAFDRLNSAYCILIPLQHQMHHRIGETMSKIPGFDFALLLPLFWTVVGFFTFYLVLGKTFCGWVCPIGFVQELLYKVGRLLQRPFHTVGEQKLGMVRSVKWFLLLVFVLGLPLLAGLGVAPHVAGDAFCQICPSRSITTILTGDFWQLAVANEDIVSLFFGALRNLLLGAILVTAITVRQPFCRICPLLAWNALFQRLSLMRLSKNRHAKCDKCSLCSHACPMEIPEISKEDGPKAFHDDCTLCGRCAEFCPDDGVIHLRWGSLTLFRSTTAYFRRRSHSERPDGSSRRPLKKEHTS